MVTPELVNKVKQSIKTAADAHYFFDNLKTADWVAPLQEAGFFRDPLGPVARGDSVSFPVWPPSRYLARIADQSPETVLNAIEDIPDNGNPRIYEDLVDAALKLPADLAVNLVPRALIWSRSEYQLLLPSRLADLAVYLSENGFPEHGLRLLRELLTILPDPRTKEITREESTWFVPRPRPRFDEWTYKEIVGKQLVDILNATGLQGLELASELLESYVRLSIRDDSKEESDDLSFIWRPAIEDHEQNHRDELGDVLIVAVRDGANTLINVAPEQATDLIREIESHPWTVFQRISFHLMRVNPELLRNEIVERLGDEKYVYSATVFHEYWLLAREQLGNLPPEKRIVFLGTLEAGPPPFQLAEMDDPEHSAKIWKWRRLSVLGYDLLDSFQIDYGQLKQEFGQTEHPEFLAYSSGVMTGPNSPLTKDQLIGMGPHGLADWLTTWEPSNSFMGPSPEGLSRELASAISDEPTLFAGTAKAFIGLQPTFIRGLLDGLKKACTDGKPFDWSEILELIQWVMLQPRGDVTNDSIDLEKDTNWVPSRRSIANLLTDGLISTSCGIPISMRQVVWSIIEPLTQDPEPIRDMEIEENSFLRNPATASINMVRGMAMHSVIRYALWIKRHVDDDQWNGFADVPEVLNVLEEHLDVGAESTTTVRAVYGQWFPWLVLLDLDWATANVDVIFSLDPDYSYLRTAAWNTFVTMAQAYENIFAILRGQYLLAIETIEDPAPEGYGWRHPATCLAEHIMVFYWRGKIAFGDSDMMLELFLSSASDELRADAIGFAGRAIGNSDDPIPDEIMNRLVDLWERRMSDIQASGEVQNYQLELAAFGWWFRASQLDDSWSINSLLAVLPEIKAIECDPHVVERLADIVQNYPYESARALALMTKQDENGWSMGLWRDAARTVLHTALHAGDDAAKLEATDLINYLAARSDRQFVDLLENLNS